MTPAAVVLATVLQFTTPSYESCATCQCGPSSVPLTDLHHVTLYGERQWSRSISKLATKPVLPGRADSISFNDQGWVWRLFVKFADQAGNESCESNAVMVGLTADVAGGKSTIAIETQGVVGGNLELRLRLPVQAPARLTLYDVAGRAYPIWNDVAGPGAVSVKPENRLQPGVYLMRLEQASQWAGGRVVVLR